MDEYKNTKVFQGRVAALGLEGAEEESDAIEAMMNGSPPPEFLQFIEEYKSGKYGAARIFQEHPRLVMALQAFLGIEIARVTERVVSMADLLDLLSLAMSLGLGMGWKLGNEDRG